MFARSCAIATRYARRTSSSIGICRGYYSSDSRSKNRRNFPLIAGIASGTVIALKLHSISDQHGDEDDNRRSYFLNGNWKDFVTSKKIALCNMDKIEADVGDDNLKLKNAAKDILEYCGVKEKEKLERIIKNMDQYINDKKSGNGEITPTEKRLINDAIHGPIELSPLLYQIINTKEFHRLKALRQQGGTHYVYPGANHTRFEHSIGVSHMAGIFARSLKQQLDIDKERAKEKDREMYEFHKDEILCAEIAGLCHDLGHGPMSHMFERVMKESLKRDVKHEQVSIAMFKRLLTNHKVLGEFVSKDLTVSHVKLIEHMIQPPPLLECNDRLFLYEIVANKLTGIDVDKWDYYQRDCHYLGVLQDFEWKRTMLLGRIVMTIAPYKGKDKLRIAFRDKEMENIYGMFRTRANIYRKACMHKTVKAVERMFMDAMDLVKDLKLVWAPNEEEPEKGSGSFKSIAEAVALAFDENPQLDWYMAMTDSIVGSIMSATAPASPESEQEKLVKAKTLLTRIEQRDLYACAARKRIAKFCPLSEFIENSHKSYSQCESCAQSIAADPGIHVVETMYKSSDKRHEFEKILHSHLSIEEKRIIKLDKIWVEVIKIKHPSEEERNPLDEVLFFEKLGSPNHLALPRVLDKDVARKNASMVVVPQAFVEYELRVYDKRPRVVRTKPQQQALKNAMNKAWKEFLQKHTQYLYRP